MLIILSVKSHACCSVFCFLLFWAHRLLCAFTALWDKYRDYYHTALSRSPDHLGTHENRAVCGVAGEEVLWKWNKVMSASCIVLFTQNVEPPAVHPSFGEERRKRIEANAYSKDLWRHRTQKHCFIIIIIIFFYLFIYCYYISNRTLLSNTKN